MLHNQRKVSGSIISVDECSIFLWNSVAIKKKLSRIKNLLIILVYLSNKELKILIDFMIAQPNKSAGTKKFVSSSVSINSKFWRIDCLNNTLF